MRHGAVSTITFISVVGFAACFPNSPTHEPLANGGASGGGTTSSAGGKSTGGGGGGTASGGSEGGATSGGGEQGGSSTASGGSSGAGGGNPPGGAGGTGAIAGNRPVGGTTARGGGVGSGGTQAGGSTGGTCTDEPPPQTPTCAEWVEYKVCTEDWFKTYCNRSCGRCSGTGPVGSGGISSPGGSSGRGGAGGTSGQAGTTSGGGGVTGPGSTNPQITGSNGWASRYWDCCKPSCSWTTGISACQKDGKAHISDRNAESVCKGASAYQCYDMAPWYDASTNMGYGFAAHAGGCGTCYLLQFTGGSHSGNNAGAAAMKGQQMIVQKINDGGDVGGEQFDLLIPGGGVGQFNGCANQWGSSTDLGAQYGGLLTECNGDPGCMKQKCQSVFGNIPDLLAGCNWFTGWFSSADNPTLVYKQVSCPDQIKAKSGVGG